MRVFRTVDELSEAIGEVLGPTDWLTIDQEQVDQFADVTGDHQWIHTEVVRAKEGPFGGTIVHGYFTLALVPCFASQLVQFQTRGARLNYGVNKVRFPHVVKVGARLRAACTIVEVAPVGAGHQLLMRYRIEIEGEDKPACVAETVVLLLNTT